MRKVYLEHANISINDFDSALDFLSTAFPSFRIRGGGGEGLEKWLHFGDDQTYIALSASPQQDPGNGPNYDKIGFNHLGFVIVDINALSMRLLEKGYQKNYPDQNETYRKRVYFLDREGNEFEFIEYLSDDVSEQNSYN